MFTSSRDSLEDLFILAAPNFSHFIHLKNTHNLLRYHLHTMKLTHLKCVIQWILVYVFTELCDP